MRSHHLGMSHKPNPPPRNEPPLISIEEQTCKCSILQASGTIWPHANQSQCTHTGGRLREQIACIIEQQLSRDCGCCVAFLDEQSRQTAECRGAVVYRGLLPAPPRTCALVLDLTGWVTVPTPDGRGFSICFQGGGAGEEWMEKAGRTVFCFGSAPPACFRRGREAGILDSPPSPP